MIVAGIDLSGEGLVFWRCALAALTLALILLAVGRRGALALRRRRLQVLGLGLMLALHWVLFFETIKRSSVAVAILLVYTAPIFLAVFAPFVLPERRSRVTSLALAISGPGIALIALGGDEGSHASAVAVATGLGAAVTYAVLIIWTKSVLTAVSPLTIAFWNYVVVSSVLAPVVLLGSARGLPTASEWPAVLVLGAVLTAVLGALFVRALRDVRGSSRRPARLRRAGLGRAARLGHPGRADRLGGRSGRARRAHRRRAHSPARRRRGSRTGRAARRGGGVGSPWWRGRNRGGPGPRTSRSSRARHRAAALGCGRWVGRGDKNAADQAAVDAMRAMLDTVYMSGVVVIGEGKGRGPDALQRRGGR